MPRSDSPGNNYNTSPTAVSSEPSTTSPYTTQEDEEAALDTSPVSAPRHRVSVGSHGLRSGTSASRASRTSQNGDENPSSPTDQARSRRTVPVRRPSSVRVVLPDPSTSVSSTTPAAQHQMRQAEGMPPITERTPLISAGVRPDLRKTMSDADPKKIEVVRAQVGLGRMVELGLPLVMWVTVLWVLLNILAERTRSAGPFFDLGGWDTLRVSDRR